MNFGHATNTMAEQAVRMIQLIGLPICAGLFVIGLLVLLTAGKNPRRKRFGYVFTIGFGVLMLLISYLPLLVYYYGGSTPAAATDRNIQQLVDSTSGVGGGFWVAIKRIAIPLTLTMFYLGVFVRLLAAKSPQRKRLGIGLMIFSPIVLGISFIMPSLVTKL